MLISAKLREPLCKKVCFLKLHMNVCLRAKFQFSSITLTSFRQGVILGPPPTAKQTPKKPTQIRLKKNLSKARRWHTSVIPITTRELEASRGTVCNFYSHLSLETVFPALKLTQNCCRNVKISFLENWQLNHNLFPPFLHTYHA